MCSLNASPRSHLWGVRLGCIAVYAERIEDLQTPTAIQPTCRWYYLYTICLVAFATLSFMPQPAQPGTTKAGEQGLRGKTIPSHTNLCASGSPLPRPCSAANQLLPSPILSLRSSLVITSADPRPHPPLARPLLPHIPPGTVPQTPMHLHLVGIRTVPHRAGAAGSCPPRPRPVANASAAAPP